MRTPWLAGLFLAFATPSAAAEARLADRMVARVNGEPILLSELRTRIRPELARHAADPAWSRVAWLRTALRAAREDAIVERLVAERAARLRIEVSDAEVDRALDSIARERKLDRAELLQLALEQGYSEPVYRRALRAQLLEYGVMRADGSSSRPSFISELRRRACVESFGRL